MQVHRKSRHLVLNVRDPNRIQTLIPNTKPLRHNGHCLLLVPHGIEEVRTLRNLNIRAPSPIRYYYDWPGKHKPFEMQRAMAEFATLHRRGYILSEMGTGKSLSVLWAVDYLRSIGEMQKALIIAPLSTLDEVWEKEIFYSFPYLTVSILHGAAERRRRLLKQNADIYIINHDGVRVIQKELMVRKDIDCVIIDELAVYRNYRARTKATPDSASDGRNQLWKAAHAVIEGRKWVWGLTGAPIPNAPTNAWAQAKLITPSTTPQYYSHFRDDTMYKVTQFKWAPRHDAVDKVHHLLQPAIRFQRSDGYDLPPTIYETRSSDLTQDQIKMYKDLCNQLYTEYNAGTITAANEGVKRMKLLQVLCGAVYDDAGEIQYVIAKPRIKIVQEIIDQAQGKIIVFAPFVNVVDMLHKELSRYVECGIVYGQTKRADRRNIFSAFAAPDGPTVLVAHPKCMSHGLNLTSAATIVWYGPYESNDVYMQANDRIRRSGQTRTQFIVHIVASTLEKEIYARLKGQQKIQGILLNMLETHTL